MDAFNADIAIVRPPRDRSGKAKTGGATFSEVLFLT
jgi:hypothetical protein